MSQPLSKNLISDIAYYAGSSLFFFAALIYAGASILLILGYRIIPHIVPISGIIVVLTPIVLWRRGTCGFGQSLLVLLIFFSVLLGSIEFSGSYYDKSWDGQAYHMEGIFQLASGWNPYYQDLDKSVVHEKWITHYAKGPWLISSALYLFLDRIEQTKAFDFIYLCGAWLLLFSVLLNVNGFSPFSAVLLTTLGVLNPVAVYQSLNFYVDGQLGTLLLVLLTTFVIYAGGKKRLSLLLLCSVTILLINIKFTAIPFVVVFVGGFLSYLLISCNKLMNRELFLAVGGGIITGILIFGYNPYVTNTVRHGHPFYPLMGSDAEDIMHFSKPKNLLNDNRFSALFMSLFSKPVNNVDGAELKIPFTIDKQLNAFYEADVRVSGFGPLFGGMLILASIALLFFLKTWRTPVLPWVWAVGVVALSVLIHPEPWWARYVPQLWLLPLIVCFACLSTASRWVRMYGLIIIVVGAVNIYIVADTYYQGNRIKTQQINKQLSELSAQDKQISVWLGPFRSTRMRLNEAGILYREVKKKYHLKCKDPTYLFGGIYQVRFCTDK